MCKFIKSLFCLCFFMMFMACEEERDQAIVEKDAYLKHEAKLLAAKGKQWDFITRSQFEEFARVGKSISVEGLAVNAKPLCYLFIQAGSAMLAPTPDRMQISATATARPPAETSWRTGTM